MSEIGNRFDLAGQFLNVFKIGLVCYLFAYVLDNAKRIDDFPVFVKFQ